MKRKIILKKKHRNKYTILFLIIIIIFAGTLFFIDLIGRVIGNKLMDYAKMETERIAKYVVNYSVNIPSTIPFIDNLFVTSKNSNNEIESIDLDTISSHKLLNTITANIINNFRAVEQGNLDIINLSNTFLLNTSIDKLKQGIVAEIPLGIITDNALLANLGPKIPVKLSIAGEIESYLDTKIENYGINNVLITVFIDITISEQIYMPIMTDSITINQKIPIAVKLIQGVVPNYYFGHLNSGI